MVEIRITGENLDELLAKVFGLRAKQAMGEDLAKDKDLEVYEVTEIAAEPEEPAQPTEEPAPVEEIKIEAVRAAGKAFMENNGRQAFKSLLSEFGLTKVTDCPKEKLGELLQKLEA